MLINGKELTTQQIAQVKAAFVHRSTFENIHTVQRINPTVHVGVLTTDEQWIREHAFHFVKDGSRLSSKHHHCEPATMAAAFQSHNQRRTI